MNELEKEVKELRDILAIIAEKQVNGILTRKDKHMLTEWSRKEVTRRRKENNQRLNDLRKSRIAAERRRYGMPHPAPDDVLEIQYGAPKGWFYSTTQLSDPLDKWTYDMLVDLQYDQKHLDIPIKIRAKGYKHKVAYVFRLCGWTICPEKQND